MRLLVVEDDAALGERLRTRLVAEGYAVDLARDGIDGAHLGATEPYDAVILDLGLPGKPGLAVLREWRAAANRVPVLILTARDGWAERVEGLQAGADDYVVKPFKPKELVARIHARLRRLEETANEVLTIGDLVVDLGAHSVSRNGTQIPVTPLEFDLLTALASRPGYAFSREQLLADVWGYQHAGDTRLVNVHVQRLRGKVELDPENPEVIVTVRGVGYRAGPP